MWRLKMENLTIVIIVLSLVIYFLECAIVEGKTLDPIYWNSSNPLFKSQGRKDQPGIHAAINDKLDIICPRKDRADGDDLFYFRLYLVDEENYKKCNATGGKRLITCDVPEQEKKYTFYFQEISPSPWGLEFDPDKSYYVISTSDGTQSGLSVLKGGVCTRFSMKLEMKIRVAEAPSVVIPSLRPPVTPLKPLPTPPTKETVEVPSYNGDNPTPFTKVDTEDEVNGNGLIIGVVLGACAVLFVVLLSFLGYKVYRKRRRLEKYQSPPITPTRGNPPLQQVTLLPISHPSQHAHRHHHGRLHSDHERHRSATLSSHNEIRPPPSYNESFLDNGGPVVAV